MKQKYRKLKGQMWKPRTLIWLTISHLFAQTFPGTQIWLRDSVPWNVMLCRSSMPITDWRSIRSNTSCVFSSILGAFYPKLSCCSQGGVQVGAHRCILYKIYLSVLLTIRFTGIHRLSIPCLRLFLFLLGRKMKNNNITDCCIMYKYVPLNIESPLYAFKTLNRMLPRQKI